jgi:hypothetical protein
LNAARNHISPLVQHRCPVLLFLRHQGWATEHQQNRYTARQIFLGSQDQRLYFSAGHVYVSEPRAYQAVFGLFPTPLLGLRKIAMYD